MSISDDLRKALERAQKRETLYRISQGLGRQLGGPTPLPEPPEADTAIGDG